MRVVLVSQEVPPATAWGGIGTYVEVLSGALADAGLDVHVISIVDGQAPNVAQAGGVTVHRFPLPRLRGPGRLAPETWRRVWLALAVARTIRRLNLAPAVIECPEWNAEGLVLAATGRIPTVVRLHSSARQLFPFTGQGRRCLGFDGRLAMSLEERSARLANVVVSTASNLAEVSDPMRLDEAALRPIPYPVRLQEPSRPADDSPPRVAFIGRLEPRKGPEVLLRAAPRVLAALPETRFAFVGRDGIEHGAPSSAAWLMREAARLGVAHAIELPGQLGPAELADELRRASVCAFPSRWESFGNVVAEASASGRPVVVSAIPPFRDLVQDGVTGRVVPNEDENAWASALLGVLTDRAGARAMGEAAAARISDISSPDRVATLTTAAYEHAIRRWHSGARAGRGALAQRGRR